MNKIFIRHINDWIDFYQKHNYTNANFLQKVKIVSMPCIVIYRIFDDAFGKWLDCEIVYMQDFYEQSNA
jgi:hypothetical protein